VRGFVDDDLSSPFARPACSATRDSLQCKSAQQHACDNSIPRLLRLGRAYVFSAARRSYRLKRSWRRRTMERGSHRQPETVTP
jgi:hypothetical protein